MPRFPDIPKPDMPLSQMLRDALDALDELKERPSFEANLMSVHSPYGDTCYVCLVGAYLHKLAGLDDDDTRDLYGVPDWAWPISNVAVDVEYEIDGRIGVSDDAYNEWHNRMLSHIANMEEDNT